MKCANQECDNETTTGYKYCGTCYVKWKTTQTIRAPDTTTYAGRTAVWDQDKLIDVLLKMNANLGMIAKHLDKLSRKNSYDELISEEEIKEALQ